jgi:ADP-ribose pyrophosphatase YjhB (NUDIX family)
MADFIRGIPEGDNREREICADCGYIAYENPKIVVGSVVVAPDRRVLLCRRAIEPRLGFWTLPAGFMELGETLEEGAMREAYEEAQARIHIEGILGVFSISRIGQVQILFRARFSDHALEEQPVTPLFGVGEESLEVGLFEWDSIPWDELAFPTARWALEAWRSVGMGAIGAPVGNPPEDPRGISPGLPRTGLLAASTGL